MTSRKIARVIIHYIWGYFVMKKLLALLLTVTLLMSVAATASAEWVRPVQTVETWDEEADFVIVGFGLAGAAAAVEAHDIDPEAKVVVLEKMPETLAGGTSIASGLFGAAGAVALRIGANVFGSVYTVLFDKAMNGLIQLVNSRECRKAV